MRRGDFTAYVPCWTCHPHMGQVSYAQIHLLDSFIRGSIGFLYSGVTILKVADRGSLWS